MVNQHQFDDEFFEDETLNTLEEFVATDEESQALVKFGEQFHEATTELAETKFNLERTPPVRRSLEFSDYKRNFLTDRLFAGNIYVGSQVSDSEEEEPEHETRETNFSSWKESFNRKMSS